jgi:hypothetical protein
MEYVGHATREDTARVVVRGDLAGREFVAFWLDEHDRILAAMNVNVWDVPDEVKPLIVARTVVDPAKVITRTEPKMGSEDFSDMLQAVPGAYFWVGHEGSVPVHNPGYFLDDKILPIGASMFARIIETRLPVGSHA